VSEGALEELLRAALRGPSAPTARATLAGAVAALRTAAPTAGPDAAGDAAEVLSALLAEVDGAGPAGDAPAAPPTRAARPPVSPASASSHASSPVSRPSEDLRDLARAFTADPEVSGWLGVTPVAADTDGETWRRLWLACLRLPDDVAERWRERGRMLLPATNDEPRWRELPGSGGVLVEPAPAFGEPGLRESPTARAHQVVTARLPPTPEYAGLRTLAGQVAQMAEHDDTLYYALESRRRAGWLPLSDPANRAYLHLDLGYRLGDLADAPAASVRALRELYLVDELLCSVLHVPPAHPRSWWGRLAQRSRATLADSAAALRAGGRQVMIRPIPPGDFDPQRELIGPHNVACPAPGRPESEILACLRVWLHVDGEVHRGRVVHVRNTG
jgi:hypothetical protein